MWWAGASNHLGHFAVGFDGVLFLFLLRSFCPVASACLLIVVDGLLSSFLDALITTCMSLVHILWPLAGMNHAPVLDLPILSSRIVMQRCYPSLPVSNLLYYHMVFSLLVPCTPFALA